MQSKNSIPSKLSIIISLMGLTITLSFCYKTQRPSPGVSLKGNRIITDPKEINRGERLSLMICSHCHGNDDGQLTGRFMEDDKLGKIYSANITNSATSGIGKWSPTQIKYFLRTGVNPSHKKALFIMPRFPLMADADLDALVAYLNSDRFAVKAVNTSTPKSSYSFLSKFIMFVGVKKLAYPQQKIQLPDTTNAVERGKYLVTAVLDCYACHSKSTSKTNLEFPEKTAGFLNGGSEFKDADNNKVISPPIAFGDIKYPAYYSLDQFKRLLQTGQKKNGESVRSPMMPQPMLSSPEINAIYAYLKTIKPIKND